MIVVAGVTVEFSMPYLGLQHGRWLKVGVPDGALFVMSPPVCTASSSMISGAKETGGEI